MRQHPYNAEQCGSFLVASDVMLLTTVAVVLAYLLGSVPGGLVLGRLIGVNLLNQGSGNAGATNAWRARGPAFAITVFLFDAAKGVVAVMLLPRIAPAPPWLPEACAAAVLIGHVYPIWYGFRGGKGFATLLGIVVALTPLALPALIGVWFLILVLSGYVSLATLAAALAYPFFLFVVPLFRYPSLLPLLIFSTGVTLFLFYTHRDNIRRLMAGTENRFERVRWFKHGRF